MPRARASRPVPRARTRGPSGSAFDQYLLDIRKLPLITDPREERRLALKARKGDQDAAARLVTANLRFVISYVKRFQGHGLALSELVAIGNEGLLKAVRKFDPSHKVKFISYAVWWIRQCVLKALAELGHEITFFEPDAFSRQQNRDILDPEWARVVVWPATRDGLQQALEQGRDAGLIVKASGVGVFGAELEAAVVAMRRPGNRILFWDVDAPATLDRVAHDPADPFRALIPRYDLICTYGGGDPVVRAYRRLGARDCVPVYNALDPSTHFAVEPDPRFAAELVTTQRRIRLFDDAGCLAAFVAEGTADPGTIQSLWVSDYLHPGIMLEAEQAHFIRSDSLRTPMDTRVVAVASRGAADSLAQSLGGTVVAWADVVSEAGSHLVH